MIDLKERIENYRKENFEGWEDPDFVETVLDAYEQGITEQDSLSRKEQREIDIQKALDVYSDLLSSKGYDLGTINDELVRLKKTLLGD